MGFKGVAFTRACYPDAFIGRRYNVIGFGVIFFIFFVVLLFVKLYLIALTSQSVT